MIENNRFRVLIIDDNPNIHSDFIKVLNISRPDNKLNDLKSQLFTSVLTASAEPAEENTPIKFPIFSIETANQGEEGVNKVVSALEEGRPFALAFVDIRMPPGIDGIKTIKQIRKVDKYIQVIICTAFSDYSWEQTVAELGLGDSLLILKKPFDNDMVRQMACTLTKKWELDRIDRQYISMLQNKSTETELAIAEHNPITLEGVLVVSNSGMVANINNEFAEIMDVEYSSIDGKSFDELLKIIAPKIKENNNFILNAQRATADPNKIISAELFLQNGKTIEYYSQGHKQNGQMIGRLWCFKDITQEKSSQKQDEYQITHDILTNLPNRIALIEYSRYAIAAANQNKSMFATVFINIAGLKLINEKYTNEIGDQLLCDFAKRIAGQIAPTDMFARLHDDKFVLISREFYDTKFILESVDQLLKTIAIPFNIANNNIDLVVNVGVSVYPKNGRNLDDLLNYAEAEMLNSKLKTGG